MAEPFLGQIMIVGFTFPPRGYAFCDGQILPINQHQSLYALLGTTYGGDGRTTFGLPDLRGRTPIHSGKSNAPGGTEFRLGQRSGVENVSLRLNEIPKHTHTVQANSKTTGRTNKPAGNVFGQASGPVYGKTSEQTSAMLKGTTTSAGTTQPHNNMQPYLTLSYCIALQGKFPSRS